MADLQSRLDLALTLALRELREQGAILPWPTVLGAVVQFAADTCDHLAREEIRRTYGGRRDLLQAQMVTMRRCLLARWDALDRGRGRLMEAWRMAGRMPTTYPDGGPFFWMNEQSGVLVAAVGAYLNGAETPEQLRLVIDYVKYWVEAPCWREVDPFAEVLGTVTLASIRERIRTVTTRAELQAWLSDALAVGIDPL